MKISRSRLSTNNPPSDTQIESKVAQRLLEAADGAEARKNRSGDLIVLTSDFETLRANLRILVGAVKKYGNVLSQVASSRDELVQQMAHMSLESPIHDSVGAELSDEAVNQLSNLDASSSPGAAVAQVMQSFQPTSLQMVQTISSAQSQLNSQEYFEHIIEYAEDWEHCVTKIIRQEIKKVKKLQADRIHYEKKVDSLRQRVNDRANPSDTLIEKLSRNEEKLKESYLLHETEASRLCTLIEAATAEGWRDLYFLVKTFMKFESNRVGRDSDIFSHLSHILESMKVTLKKHKTKPNGTY